MLPIAVPGQRWNHLIAALLLGLLPMCLVLHGRVKIIVPAVLFFAGLYLLAKRREVRDGCIRTRFVILMASLMLALAIINVVWHRLPLSDLGVTSHILLYLVIAAVFAVMPNLRLMWRLFSLTAAVLGVMSIVQHFGYDVARTYRPNAGVYTAIPYAIFLFGLALTSLVQMLRPQQQHWERWLHGAGLVLSAYAGLLSGSRGPAGSFVLTLLVLMAVYAHRRHCWRRVLAGLAVLLVGTSIAVISAPRIAQRAAQVPAHLVEFSHGDVDTSLGLRLEMWRTAIRGTVTYPVMGIGIHQFNAYLDAEAAAGRTNAAVTKLPLPHAHNTYLNIAVERGIPGFLALLGLFVASLVFFLRHTRDEAQRMEWDAWAGVAISVFFPLCGVTACVFHRIPPLSLYYLLTLGLAVFIATPKIRDPSREPAG